MEYLINNLFNQVNVLVNKDQRGKITPFEFNNFCSIAIDKLINNSLFDNQRVAFKENRGVTATQFAQTRKFIEQEIEYYLIPDYELTSTNEWFNLPTDLLYIAKITDNAGNIINKRTELSILQLQSSRNKPTKCFSVYSLVGERVRTSPTFSEIYITYIRTYKKPKWTYNEVSGVALFNPNATDFQDLDIPKAWYKDVLNEVLQLAGVSIREQEQYTEQEQQVETQKQES